MRGMPPAVVLALEPKVERAISLQLSDILDQVPSGYAKSADSFDVNRPILLNATEIEKGMAVGKPSISLAAIYDQAPEIFLHRLAPADATRVPLPYDKVLEQFASMQVRPDQMRDQTVPQLETPILQAAIEDTERFGTTISPIQMSALPPVKVEPATAQTLSMANPEGVARETLAAPVTSRHGIPLNPLGTKKESRDSVVEPGTAPTRIPFHLPPNGAGEPASERVPASSGPPVPTSLPVSSSPARIPFKMSAPCADLRPKFTLVPGMEPREEIAPAATSSRSEKTETKIALSLQAVMQNMPAFQLSGSPSAVPEDVRIELLFSLIEPQLASGRVAIAPKTFQDAMPEAYRDLFIVDPTETSVLLPLQEVLKNLPAAALRMRDDQEAMEAVDFVETPFSVKAQEDAKRFQASEAAIPKPEEQPDQVESSTGKEVPTPAEQPEAPTERAEKGESEGINKAKEVVATAGNLSGVAGCSVTFADGLSLAGNLPVEAEADGLCAMAPSLLQRIDKYMLDTKLGSLTAVTLHCEKSPVTFFMQGNICLTVLHASPELGPDTQQKLAEMAKELSHVYAQPEASHVDH